MIQNVLTVTYLNCYSKHWLIFSRQYHLTILTTKRIFTEDDMSFVSVKIASCIGFQNNVQIKHVPVPGNCINAVIWRQIKIIIWRQHHEFELDICLLLYVWRLFSIGARIVICLWFIASKRVTSCHLHIRKIL